MTDLDGNTGTVRMQTRLDGFLTPASHKSAKSIALGYVRTHLTELGLSSGDMTTFHLGRTTATSPAPTTSSSPSGSPVSRCSATD